MRNTITKLATFLAVCGSSVLAAGAAQKINPLTQITWSNLSGTTAPALTCNSTYYGMPYTNRSTGDFYVCAASGWVLVTGGGGGGIGGSGTTGYLVEFAGSTTVGNSPIDDGVTTANTVTIAKKTAINDTANPSQLDMTYNAGHAPSGTSGLASIAPDTSGNLTASENGAAYSRVCTAANGICTGGGGGGPYPTGSTYVAMGNSFLLVNGYYTIAPTTYSCSSGVCTIQTPGTNNFVAGENLAFVSGGPACLANTNQVVDSTSLTSQQFRISGTSCGTTSGSFTGGLYLTQTTNGTVSCTSNVCTVPAGNGFVAGHDVMFNPDFAPSCLRGRAFKVLSSGLSSSQFEVDTTGLTACGTTTGAGGVIWSGDTSAIETAVLGSSTTFTGFAPFALNFYNLALSDDSGNLGSNNGVLSSIVSNYTSYYHPFIANLVTASAGKPVVVGIYTNEANGTSYATDIANFLTLAADLHAEGSNVYVWLHTIPPAIGSDPNTISNPNVAASWAEENAWMSTQIGPSHASAAGKYFDRVISLEASFTGGMQLDASHLNNSGTYQFASIENTEAAAQGGSMKQQSPSLAALANYSTAFNYQCDSGSPTTCAMWRWNHNTGSFLLTFGDPLVAGNATDVIEALSTPQLKIKVAPVFTTVTGSTQCLQVDSAGQMSGTGSACGTGSGGLSGMTAGQVPIAATASTVTSSKALAGSGAGITTGPTSATTGNCVVFTGSGGQIADSGSACGSSGIANTTFTTSTSSVAANTCNGAVTVTMTGVTTSSVFMITPSSDTAAITGWGSTGGLILDTWPTANTLNYKICNQTGSSITPGAVTFNVGAR